MVHSVLAAVCNVDDILPTIATGRGTRLASGSAVCARADISLPGRFAIERGDGLKAGEVITAGGQGLPVEYIYFAVGAAQNAGLFQLFKFYAGALP